MASNPMQQFTVHKIGPEIKIAGIDLSFTNASLFMIISASVILLFLFLGSKEKIVPNKIQLVAEMFYAFVAKMISDTAGSKAKPYFLLYFLYLCLFYFATWWECCRTLYRHKSYYCDINNGPIYIYSSY